MKHQQFGRVREAGSCGIPEGMTDSLPPLLLPTLSLVPVNRHGAGNQCHVKCLRKTCSLMRVSTQRLPQG